MTIQSQVCGATIAALMALAMPASAQEAASTLPGGASSLQETYQDWSLACQGTPQTVCVITQQQMQQNGQRVLAIELGTSNDGGLTGNLVLPFGLRLDAGATLQVDEGATQAPLRFSTCLPAGCLVPLEFDADQLAALRAGTALKIMVQGMDASETALSISLRGLSAAIDRLEALTA